MKQKTNTKRKCQINLTKIFIKIVLCPSKRLRWRKYQFPHILYPHAYTYRFRCQRYIFCSSYFFLSQNVIYLILIPWPCCVRSTTTVRISRICCVFCCTPHCVVRIFVSLAFLIPNNFFSLLLLLILLILRYTYVQSQ